MPHDFGARLGNADLVSGCKVGASAHDLSDLAVSDIRHADLQSVRVRMRLYFLYLSYDYIVEFR